MEGTMVDLLLLLILTKDHKVLHLHTIHITMDTLLILVTLLNHHTHIPSLNN
jgi:hypothetical protein